MSHKHPHSESGRTRNERREHDRKAKHHAETVPSGLQVSPMVRRVIMVVLVVVVIGVTLLFMGGVIRW